MPKPGGSELGQPGDRGRSQRNEKRPVSITTMATLTGLHGIGSNTDYTQLGKFSPRHDLIMSVAIVPYSSTIFGWSQQSIPMYNATTKACLSIPNSSANLPSRLICSLVIVHLSFEKSNQFESLPRIGTGQSIESTGLQLREDIVDVQFCFDSLGERRVKVSLTALTGNKSRDCGQYRIGRVFRG